MSYKNQILKQLANGRYGKKTYLDLVRKKTNIKSNEQDTVIVPEPEVSVPITEMEHAETDIVLNPVNNNETIDLSIKPQSDKKKSNHQKKNKNKTKIKKNNSVPILSETIDNEGSLPEPMTNLELNHDDRFKITNLENKILELEDYVVEIGIEIENLKNNQSNMIQAINKLALEINIAKNKIVR